MNGFDDSHELHGVLSVEHTGDSKGNSDGFLLTVLVECASGAISSSPLWVPIQDGNLTKHLGLLMEDSLCPAVV